jgi:hypothetical protein
VLERHLDQIFVVAIATAEDATQGPIDRGEQLGVEFGRDSVVTLDDGIDELVVRFRRLPIAGAVDDPAPPRLT